MKAAGINWVRLHDAGTPYIGWYHLEPEKGKWQFRDDAIQRYREWKIKILGDLQTAPLWASSYKGSGKQSVHGYFDTYWTVEDWDGWTNYVKTVCSRYKGIIDGYYVWNEPAPDNGACFLHDGYIEGKGYSLTKTDGAKNQARLCELATKMAKEVDPSLYISGPNINSGGVTGRKFNQAMIDAGSFNYCDFIDYHVYIQTEAGFPGDKLEQKISSDSESNPFLGLRAVRLCLKERPDILRTQLRALLRASACGNLKVMFPMISCSEEVTELKKFMDNVKDELTSEQCDFNKAMEVGIMIETPAAAMISDTLAGMVDFFSIGTNDLVQYTMAIDRSNERVAYLYHPSHPAILELIHRVSQAARRHNIWVSVCGQMAGEPQYTPLLVGLGVHELSMSPTSLGAVRRIVRKLSMYEAEKAAMEAMKCATSAEALDISLAVLNKISPEIANLALKGL